MVAQLPRAAGRGRSYPKLLFLVALVAGSLGTLSYQVHWRTRAAWQGPLRLPSDSGTTTASRASLGLRGGLEANADAPTVVAAAVNHSGLLMDDGVVKELPDFWQPPPGVGLDAVSSEVGGEPTIFVGIASYRDALCHSTLREALRWADSPRRLVFGVVEQNALDEAAELRCDYTPRPCSDDPSQLLCVHRSQIRLLRVDAAEARGPCFGRHRAERLYRGEHFALQLDAHMYFVKGWDTRIIAQWRETRNEYAVLSTYPSDYRNGNAISESGEGLTKTAPLICSSYFEPSGMVRPRAAMETAPDRSIVGRSPILVPLWGAGISFSRGHRIVRVPYDCCLDMMFAGEEFSMAVRMWTHGYDFYVPQSSVAFHPYGRPKPPKLFWENVHLAPDAADRSARRVLALLGSPPADGDYDTTGIGVGGRYGLGERRPLDLYLQLFGFDIPRRQSRDNCQWVLSMSMHKDLVRFLREDGKGIDYGKVPVKALLDGHFPHRGRPQACSYRGPVAGFLGGCCQECRAFSSLGEAQAECSRDGSCGGVVADGRRYELREGSQGARIWASPAGEESYVKEGCRG